MGRGESRVLFEKQVPSFPTIQAAFFVQTGLEIEFAATMNVTNICSTASEVASLLARDAEAVAEIETRKQFSYKENPGRYEEWALARDTARHALKKFTHISSIKLIIPEFYEIEFDLEGNTLTLIWYANNYYGIVSLTKVLLDLGGQTVGAGDVLNSDYSEAWKKLKRWSEYKWYNRPRK